MLRPAMKLRCPVCGSERLAWSDETGYLVCQDCGAIIEQLIAEEQRLLRDQTPRRVKAAEAARPLKGPLERAVEEMASRALRRGKLLDVRAGMVRLRSLATGRPSSRAVIEALNLMRSYPQLYFRTERVRLGVAEYLTLRALGASRSRALKEAARASGASAKSIDKVVRAHRNASESLEVALRNALIKGGEALLRSACKPYNSQTHLLIRGQTFGAQAHSC